MIARYLDVIKKQSIKEKEILNKNSGKEIKFIKNMNLLINTIDYIKESVLKMHDLFLNMIEEPYNNNISFNAEEDNSNKLIVEMIGLVVQVFELKFESVLNSYFFRINWERVDLIEILPIYLKELNNLENLYSINFKESSLSNVYLIRFLKGIADSIINQYIEAVNKIKKLNEMGIQQIISGILNRLFRDGKTNFKSGN